MYAYCTYTLLLWVGNRDRPSLSFLSLSLCIFLFIFSPLFEVVITLRVSFDALMNRLFSCDALENGNYDSLSLSFSWTVCVFLSAKVLLLISPVTFSFIFLTHHCIFGANLHNYFSLNIDLVSCSLSLQPIHYFSFSFCAFVIIITLLAVLYLCYLLFPLCPLLTQTVFWVATNSLPLSLLRLWICVCGFLFIKCAGHHVITICVWAGPHQRLIMIINLWSEGRKNRERCKRRTTVFYFNLVDDQHEYLLFNTLIFTSRTNQYLLRGVVHEYISVFSYTKPHSDVQSTLLLCCFEVFFSLFFLCNCLVVVALLFCQICMAPWIQN